MNGGTYENGHCSCPEELAEEKVSEAEYLVRYARTLVAALLPVLCRESWLYKYKKMIR